MAMMLAAFRPTAQTHGTDHAALETTPRGGGSAAIQARVSPGWRRCFRRAGAASAAGRQRRNAAGSAALLLAALS